MFNLLINNSFSYLSHVIAAFTFLSTGWLYLDSWRVNKNVRTPLLRSCGFLILFLSHLLQAVDTEIAMINLLSQVLKVAGYALIFLSLSVEPILKRPSTTKGVLLNSLLPVWLISYAYLSQVLACAASLGSGLIAFTYYLKATKGLEKQLKQASLAFSFIFLSDLLSLSFFFANTPVVFWSRILADYGPLWQVTSTLELIGSVLLFWWAMGYLRFRLQSQLFVITLRLIIPIFLATTFSFSYLTLANLEQDLLSSLKTDTRLFQYSLERQQLEALAAARTIASDTSIINMNKQTPTQLKTILDSVAQVQKLDSAALILPDGRILSSTTETENESDVAGNSLFISAQSGTPMATIIAKQNGPLPQIVIEAAVPVITRDKVVGVIKTGYVIDQAFVDGIKAVTGLDVSIFASDTRAATTLTYEDGQTRLLGTQESNPNILMTVLRNGTNYNGKNRIHNTDRYVSYEPLKSHGDQTIGMLSASLPEDVLLDNLRRASSLTFIISLAIIVVSIIPTYFLSRTITKNITS